MTGLEHIPDLLRQATDEINRLRAQRDRLAEALREIDRTTTGSMSLCHIQEVSKLALDSLNSTAPATVPDLIEPHHLRD